MRRHRSSSHLRSLRALLVATAAVALVATAAWGPSAVAGATAATVTYQADTVVPGPLPSAYPATTNNDGWAVALSKTQVFNVNHHRSDLEVTCHNQIDATFCWPAQSKTVSDGVHQFATSVAPGLQINQSTGHLFVYAVETPGNTAGVVCIDTTQPVAAPGTSLFCGFTPLSAPGDAPIATFAGISSPSLVGSNWFAFNEVAGTDTGTQNTMLCFNVATATACPSQPYTVFPRGIVPAPFTTAGAMGQAGTDLFPQVADASKSRLTCFDAVNLVPCSGVWPNAIPAIAGPPVPDYGTSGTVLGVCLAYGANKCFDLTGASLTTPLNFHSAIGTSNSDNGLPLTIGNSVYVPIAGSSSVACYNFTTNAGCAGYPRTFTSPKLVGLYTVNADPQRPNCIWVGSDSGTAEIQNFDAATGGACPHGPLRVRSDALVAQDRSCQPTSYTSLQITSPPRSTYASGTVSFEDNQGNPVAGLPTASISALGIANLSGINIVSKIALPQFVVNFTGLNPAPANFGIKLTWAAPYGPNCQSSNQQTPGNLGYALVASDGGIFNYGKAGFYGSTGNIALNKPIVGMAYTPTKHGYWMVASDGGIFAFGDAPFKGSTGNLTLNKPIVGMASTPTGKGYWLVASDGGIFSFGDAHFWGSAGNIPLNKPIVAMAPTGDGGGYWLVASDGGIFNYGDAGFSGSAGSVPLNKPIVGMAANPNGGGYWLVASDGGIFNYGTAGFLGSAGAIPLNKPIVGMAATFDGKGYWMVASDGGIFNYGDAGFYGSAGNLSLNKPIVGMAS
jgi:hypothetical protein